MAIEIRHSERFETRHLGPREDEISRMLSTLGYASMDDFMADVVPASILRSEPLALPEAMSETEVLVRAREIAAKNRVLRSYIGMGYHGTITPAVIQRNILENPGWYTQYTPYQAEISQGRLEALLNYQTMVIDLTGLEIANASLLDEGTAAAEAMSMLAGEVKRGEERDVFLVSDACHPQTIAVVQTRARPLGIEVVVGDWETYEFSDQVFGALVQYPTTDGLVVDYREFCDRAHAAGSGVVVAADLMALTLLTPPGEFGADIAVGSTQRFGVPMGYGGPHAAYLAAHDGFKRKMPGRIIGVSVDADGNQALRMALQTREQHIRREKATSNICTAQVLLAVMAGMYGVYHGPEGLRRIAQRIHNQTTVLAKGLVRLGHHVVHGHFFDTLRVRPAGTSADEVMDAALGLGINLRDFEDGTLGIALDETVTPADLDDLFTAFSGGDRVGFAEELSGGVEAVEFPRPLVRTSAYMEHPVFHSHRSETELLRYTKKLESRDLSLTTSMIPLGSCTMKLNATTEMVPITWPEFGALHPFVPRDQALGFEELVGELGSWLLEITGFHGVSMQPNSGAQGEYAGLLTIRGYHEAQGEDHRNVCLIPASAHGTNPASAVMAGMNVVVVKTDDRGNIDLVDLKAKAEMHSEKLAAIMVTYPSTHGVFEEEIREICDLVHEHGGQVYMDGANLNAQVGLSRPGEFGADVLHINLHKTFAIPHGGGGPGMGPICCAEHLTPHLPDHPMRRSGAKDRPDTVSAAPWGSASILVISWAYIAMLGARGVRRASEVAILNANYMAQRLNPHFPVLYTGAKGRVGHEFILDLHDARRDSGVTDEDVAKRLMDYGFHAPTQSFPVIGTLMVEPTESEPLSELDRLCDALISIRAEIQEVVDGTADREDNVLKNAPHTARFVNRDDWTHPYGREAAAYPLPGLLEHKFWPYVRRVNNAHGDRNLICACPPIEEYAGSE
jgi:glycine dehydrogenase